VESINNRAGIKQYRSKPPQQALIDLLLHLTRHDVPSSFS
jgi:hypothetical protein